MLTGLILLQKFGVVSLKNGPEFVVEVMRKPVEMT